MNGKEFKIRCDRGKITYIYNDDLADALSGIPGSVSTFRASHVEPADDGSWIADLRPVGGPVLSGFHRRQEALNAELEWLEKHIIDGEM